MLQIKDLTLIHRKDLHVLVRDFSLTVNRGDRIALIGEEGNGKSTLLKWIYDPRIVEDYIEYEGTCASGGIRMAYLPQELASDDKEIPVRDYLTGREGAESGADMDGQPGFGQRADLYRALKTLGLPPDLPDSPQTMGTLSGGERIKIQLAKLMLSEPDLWLLDEPSNDLDIGALRWLEGFIAAPGRTVLFISHDETLLARTANRIVLIEQLRRKQVPRHTVANMPFTEFRTEREAAFAKQAQIAGSERREERKALEKFRRIEQKVEHEQNSISRQDPHSGRLLKKKMASVKAMERRYAREHETMTEVPEQEEAITIRFENMKPIPKSKVVLDLKMPELSGGGRILARDLSLVVRGGEKVGIVGTNGVGKSTLLREIRTMLSGRGDLEVFYMPQDYAQLLDMDFLPAAFLAPSGRKEETTAARTYLGSMKFTADEMSHPVRDLSGGQKAKLLFLKMSLSGANVLLLDEPTRNISPLSGPKIRELLRAYEGCIISVSHDRKYIGEVCGTVYEMTSDGLKPAERVLQ